MGIEVRAVRGKKKYRYSSILEQLLLHEHDG